MTAPITSIRNLGPAMERDFSRAGVTSAEQLFALGPDEAYRKLIAVGVRPHFIGYYALAMGLQGRPWDDCTGDEKAALRVRFDALKADAPPDSNRIERILDQIGVRPSE